MALPAGSRRIFSTLGIFAQSHENFHQWRLANDRPQASWFVHQSLAPLCKSSFLLWLVRQNSRRLECISQRKNPCNQTNQIIAKCRILQGKSNPALQLIPPKISRCSAMCCGYCDSPQSRLNTATAVPSTTVKQQARAPTCSRNKNNKSNVKHRSLHQAGERLPAERKYDMTWPIPNNRHFSRTSKATSKIFGAATFWITRVDPLSLAARV